MPLIETFDKLTLGLRIDNTEIPALVDRFLELTSPEHSYIYGDFTVCPFEPDTRGRMRSACISHADKLIVQDVQQLRPPFRLSSTWPQ